MNNNIVVLSGGTGGATIGGHFSQLYHDKSIAFDSLTFGQSPYDGGDPEKGGGHSGQLQREHGIWPGIGDFRKLILALSKPWMDKDVYDMFDNRVGGVSIGNLNMFSAMAKFKDGNRDNGLTKGIRVFCKACGLPDRFTVLPVSRDRATLVATLVNGGKVRGEANICEHLDSGESRIASVALESPSGSKDPVIYQKLAEAISGADKLVICPGSPWTSIAAVLVAGDCRDVIKNSEARIYMIMNLMTRRDEASQWDSADFIRHVHSLIGRPIDVVLQNDFSSLKNLRPHVVESIFEKYQEKHFFPVAFREAPKGMVGRLIAGHFADWVGEEGFCHNDNAVRAIMEN